MARSLQRVDNYKLLRARFAKWSTYGAIILLWIQTLFVCYCLMPSTSRFAPLSVFIGILHIFLQISRHRLFIVLVSTLILSAAYYKLQNLPVEFAKQRVLNLPSIHKVYPYMKLEEDLIPSTVGPYGKFILPHNTEEEFIAMHHAVRSAMAYPKSPTVTGDDFAIIIPARDEDLFISKTIKFVVENTPSQFLKEIIVVDDASKTPIETIVTSELPISLLERVKVIRFDYKIGLIRARIEGANTATASNLIFLDAHCRPKKGWIPPLLTHLRVNYKRIVCPIIQDIHNVTWEDTGTHGTKMFFDWIFEFNWYEDSSYEVPLGSGGIFAMTKQWWIESGQYDQDMLEWGGENFEQSFRVWLCGGEIHTSYNSFVGHIFSRAEKPNPENRLIIQVQKNQKRAAIIWLDQYYPYFYEYHVEARPRDPGPRLAERQTLQRRLGCLPFSWYVTKFRDFFDESALLEQEFFVIKHFMTRLCVTGKRSVLSLSLCNEDDAHQRFYVAGGNRHLYNYGTKKCLSLNASKQTVRLETCQWARGNEDTLDRLWQFDPLDTQRIYTVSTSEIDMDNRVDMKILDLREASKFSPLCVEVSITNGQIFFKADACTYPETEGLATWDDPQGFVYHDYKA